MHLDQFKKKMKRIPDTPGVYFFLDKTKKVLYIGKATSLRDRMRSYFSPDLIDTRGPLITSMIERAASIDWRETDSVLEALILEANLIKTYKPKHNTDLKDDKSWNYVVITKEDFPRVLLVRGKELQGSTLRPGSPRSNLKILHTFGPFPHGLQLKEALKIIRKIFPYRDTCTPCENTKDRPLYYKGRSFVKYCKPCFNRQVGLCPGVCSGEISKTEYRKIISRIAMLFRGKKKELLKSLERDMKLAAKAERFEEAARLRSQVFALGHIRDVSLIKNEYRSPTLGFGGMRSSRIEAYDIAHLAGSSHVGVMVVIENGEAMKSEYRKFRIRQAKPGDDPGSLREILSRRLAHDEWPMPRIIAVDGSTAQINTAESVLREYSMSIPVVGVVKDEKHRPRAILGLSREEYKKSRPELEKDILLANSEAHRFAITYHRNDRSKKMFRS